MREFGLSPVDFLQWLNGKSLDWVRRPENSNPYTSLSTPRNPEGLQTVKMTPEQFKEARQSLGFTQRQLAALWGMGQNGERTIRRWEVGKVPVNPIASYCIGLMLNHRP